MINVTKPHLPDRKKLDSYIDRIYAKCWLTNNGPLVQELTHRLEEYLGVENLLLVSNGTLALQIAYRALGIKGSALTTPFSFVATTSSLVWEGIEPKFVDIEKDTFCMDPELIEDGIVANTSAIVPVHVFGNPCDVDRIGEIAIKRELKIIYDASHAFGVNYNGKSVLRYGDASTLSFHATKLFHTIEGGAIVFKNKDVYEKAKLLINFGIDGPDSIVGVGINAKMNEFQAAMGLAVLDEIDSIIAGRKKVWDKYQALLGDSQIQMQRYNINATRNYAYMPVLFENEKELLEAVARMRENDINPRRYFYPSLDTIPYVVGDTPISRDISKRILCLPMYDALLLSDLVDICQEVCP